MVPKWVITPEIQDYDNINIGETFEKQTFTFTNAWLVAVTLGTVTLTGTDAGEFSIVADTCSGVTLVDDCTVEVSFHPTSSGLKKAQISVPVSGVPGSPFTAQLEGTGIDEYNPLPDKSGKWGHIQLARKRVAPPLPNEPYIAWESGGGASVFGPDTGLGVYVENDNGNITPEEEQTVVTSSYLSTARKDGSLILETTEETPTVPETDWDRLVLADNDTMAVTDKTWESDREAVSVAIRMDADKTYSNEDFAGEYYVIGYEYESGVKRSWSEVITADGAGTFDRVSTRNEDGTPSTDSQNGIPYTVAADGTVDYAGANYTSFLSGDGSLAVITHPRENNPANPKFRFLMKKGDRAYTTADLEGNWAFAMFGDDKFGEFLSGFGSLYCDSNGNCRMALRGQKGGQTVYQYAQLGRMSVNPDGSIDSLDNPGTPAYSAAIGNNGNTFINNDSFGLNTDQRMIIIGVKAEASYNLAGWPLPFMNIDLNSPYDNSIKHMLHLPEDGSGGFLKKSSYDSWEAGIAENGTMVTTEGIEDGPYDMTVFDIPTKNLTLIDTATTKRAAFPYYDESAPKERILYLDSNNDGALKRMETDGTIIIEPPLASPTAGWWFDTFWMGPFGKQLVVVETDGTNIKLVYMLVDGSSQVELTPVEEGKWYNVSWRPDGKGIFYYWGLSNDGYNDTYYVIDLSNMAAYSQLNDVYDLSLRDLDQPGNIVAYTKTGNLLSLTYQELYDANGNFLADVSAQVPLLDSTFFGHDPIGKVFFADLDGTNIRPFVEPISSQITDDAFNDYNPQVNDNGYVVWRGNDGNDDEIYLYNGTSTIQLTDNDYSDGLPQINGSGQVVWLEINTTGGVNDIYFYDNALPATNITLGTNAWAWRPQINDNGDIVWADNRNDGEIYLKEYGASTITLSELDGVNTLEDANPQINNNGYVVWRRDDPDGEIMLYDGSTITKLTDNTTYDGSPQINNNNY
ncbi:choice-of-anchor D domain-containing protein, partial [Thermodesulfobacteriota bacterium]